MTDINRLSGYDQVESNDLIPVYSVAAGDTRKVPAGSFANVVAGEVLAEVNAASASVLATRNAYEDLVYPGIYAVAPSVKPRSGAPSADGDRAVIMVGGTPIEHVRLSGAWIIPNVDAVQLAAANGAGLVGFQSGATSPRTQTVRQVLDKTVRLSGVSSLFGGTLQLTNAVAWGVAQNATLLIDEDVSIAGTISPPAGFRCKYEGGTITQTTALAPIFDCATAGWREFYKLKCVGKGTDYVNNSSVYSAAAIVVRAGAAADVFRCELTNFAGAGVRAITGALGFSVVKTKITGPGAPYIIPLTSNYGACVAVDNAVTDWRVSQCDLSNHAQGIATGDSLENVFVTDNYIHDIIGQHGAYIESVGGFVYSGNLTKRTTLCGMKVQIGTTLAPDADGFVISSSVFMSTGSHAILLTNPPGGAPRLRRFAITGITARSVVGVDSGIHLNNSINGVVSGCTLTGYGRGLTLDVCSDILVSDVKTLDSNYESLRIINSTDCDFVNLVLKNPGKALDSATSWGVHILGASSASLRFKNVRASDSAGLMRAGLWIEDGDQASMEFDSCSFIDGNQYGARMISTKALGRWENCHAAGVLDRYLGYPTGFTFPGGSGETFQSPVLPVYGIYRDGDTIMLTDQIQSTSPGWRVTTSGGAMSAQWVTGSTYAAGIWLRNASARVYRLETAGGGTATVEPVGISIGVTETGADGYVWRCMSTASARFSPLPALGAAAALP